MLGLFKSKKETSRSRILLIVDDEPDFVSTLQCRLECRNCEVITAADGKEGLEKAIGEKPDLILLDIYMPVMNGREMLERLRNLPDLKNTPVIMLTAFSEAEDIAAVSALGIADYVTKPFDFTELTEKIENNLGNKKSG